MRSGRDWRSSTRWRDSKETRRERWSFARTIAETDEVGRCTSGPTSPLEPVVGFTWTGSCSADDYAKMAAGSVKGISRSEATCSESSAPSCVERPFAREESAWQAGFQPLSARLITYWLGG